eukprot:4891270-Pyramimonas_sp.AAC.1
MCAICERSSSSSSRTRSAARCPSPFRSRRISSSAAASWRSVAAARIEASSASFSASATWRPKKPSARVRVGGRARFRQASQGRVLAGTYSQGRGVGKEREEETYSQAKVGQKRSTNPTQRGPITRTFTAAISRRASPCERSRECSLAAAAAAAAASASAARPSASSLLSSLATAASPAVASASSASRSSSRRARLLPAA